MRPQREYGWACPFGARQPHYRWGKEGRQAAS
jgi:hypothetical protein